MYTAKNINLIPCMFAKKLRLVTDSYPFCFSIYMQLSCVSSSAALANRVKYPNYFQLLAADAGLANGFLAIIKQFGWRRVALIVQEENLLTVVSLM